MLTIGDGAGDVFVVLLLDFAAECGVREFEASGSQVGADDSLSLHLLLIEV